MIDPRTVERTCCLDQTCEYCVAGNDDDGPTGWRSVKKKMPRIKKSHNIEMMSWGAFTRQLKDNYKHVQADNLPRQNAKSAPLLQHWSKLKEKNDAIESRMAKERPILSLNVD